MNPPTFEEIYSAEVVPEEFWANFDRREWLTHDAGKLMKQTVAGDAEMCNAKELAETVERSVDDVPALTECITDMKNVLERLNARPQEDATINLYERVVLHDLYRVNNLVNRRLRSLLREESLPHLTDEYLTCFDSIQAFYELMNRFHGNKEAATSALNNLCQTLDVTHYEILKHWIDHIRAENARLEALRNGWQVEQQEGQQEGQQEEKQEEKQTDGEVVDPSGGFDGTRTMADGRRVTRVKKGDLPPPSEGRRYIQLTPADPKYPSVEVEVLPGETDESAMDRAGKEFNRKCQEMAAMVTALEVSEYDVTDKGCIETTETTVDRLWTDSNLPSCGLPKVPANTPNESNSADCLENPRCVIGSEAVHCMPMASEGLQESLVMSPSVFPPAGMGSEGTNQTIMAPPSAYIKRPGRQKKKGYWCGL